MHHSAMSNGKSFFDCYGQHFSQTETVSVVDIGSQDVNGSLRDVCPRDFKYTGVDFVVAKNVDVVLTDPYVLPFADESVDIVLSSSCFEHSEMFWLAFLEVLRILKPCGLFYLNAPSRGDYHRYPVDCWRFYPDSGIALNNWAQRNQINSVMLESFTQPDGTWGDFVAVFLKDATFLKQFPTRMLDAKEDCLNGRQERFGDQLINLSYANREVLSPMARIVPKSARPIARKVYRSIVGRR